MSRAGVRGLLVTAEMVGRPKVSRLMKVLKKSPDILAVIDHPDNVAELQQAAEAGKIRLGIMIDLNVGSNRTGSLPGEPALLLAEKIGEVQKPGTQRNLRVRGTFIPCRKSGFFTITAGRHSDF